jgi:hypothetical protein
MQEHDQLGQAIVDLCLHVAAHADDWQGRALAISPVFGTAVGLGVIVVRAVPILWRLRVPLLVVYNALKKKGT